MSVVRRPPVVRPGDRVRFDGAVHTVVGISRMLVRLADGLGQSQQLYDSGASISKIAQTFKTGRSTIYRYITPQPAN